MKKIIVFMLATIVIVSAHGQKDRIREQRGFRDKMMAEIIQLSDEQKQKAKSLNEDYRKKMDELRKKDDILVKDWRNQMTELNKKHRENMQDLLSKEQKAQIEKMKLERKKIAAIDGNARMEKMKVRLDLSNDQMEKVKKQRMESLEKMKAIRENRSLDMMKKREEMKTLMQKRNENMKSILNEEQMKKMKETRKTTPRKRRVVS